MGIPISKYISKSNRWEIRGKSGKLKMTIDDSNPAAIGKMYAAVGSNVAFDVGSYSVAVGSIPLTGVKAGDVVIGNPKTALGANIGIAGLMVSGNDNVNVYAVNSAAAAGSLPAMGWDLLSIRRIT